MAKTDFAPAQEFFDMWFETYNGTFGRFWETPAVGPTREKSEKAMKGFSKIADFYSACASSSVALQTVSMEAMRRTQEKIASGIVGEIRPDSYKDFYKIWMDTYSETFDEFLKSDDFAAVLGDMMSESIELQGFNREMLEENVLSPMNLPTKSEIDEINKEVYLLKKAAKETTRQNADFPTKAAIDEIKKELRSQKTTVAKVARQATDMPSKAEINGIKKELQSLKKTINDLTKQAKKKPDKK